MTFVVAEEEADGAGEAAAVLAEHLGLVAVLAAVLVKTALLEDGVGILRDRRFQNLHLDCRTRGRLGGNYVRFRQCLSADRFLRITQASFWKGVNSVFLVL